MEALLMYKAIRHSRPQKPNNLLISPILFESSNTNNPFCLTVKKYLYISQLISCENHSSCRYPFQRENGTGFTGSMPKKIQIKLVSSAGELLNVVTCRSGRIAVLRGASPSDLRPYQRALSGTSDVENILVTCDGNSFEYEQHFTFGFGEVSPFQGQTVKDFLSASSVPLEAHQPLLMSAGLSEIYDKNCATLSTDEQTRLRLITATTDSSKALILNNPFEGVGSNWRETMAELFVSFAKSRNALIIVPSLSFRPECWIDNDIIDRIQVGHTAQRTIGFGSSDLSSTTMMAELTAKVRREHALKNQGESSTNRQSASLAAGALGTLPDETHAPSSPTTATSAISSKFIKISSVLIGVAAGTWGALTILDSTPPETSGKSQTLALTKTKKSKHLQQSSPTKPQAGSNKAASSQLAKKAVSNKQKKQARVAPPAKRYLLDLYPVAIKNALIDTANGVLPPLEEVPHSAQKDSANKSQAKNHGSFFSLLENASSKGSSSPEQAPGSQYSRSYSRSYTDDEHESEMEARREQIRNRFLEAIRQNALRRQAALDEDDDF
jgi:hypothetical protein